MKNRKYDLWLSRVEDIGPAKLHRIYAACASAEECYHLPEKELLMIYGLEDKDVRKILASKEHADLDREYEEFEKTGIRMVGPEDPDFPEVLKEISSPPYWLFVRGRLPDFSRPRVAVVGARTCSDYGRSMARLIAKVLAEANVQVISGMARGIDSQAHLGALSAERDTYAILGCGVDVCYPLESRGIFTEIPKRGGLISEYPPGEEPRAGYFPVRNRLISGFSDAVVVVEARKRSGSLITADLALEQGRDVYALPGRITDSLSVGTNRLIAQGATPVISMADLLKDLEITNASFREKEPRETVSLVKTEQKVFQKLSFESADMERLLKETGLSIPTLTEILVKLQNLGLVEESFKNYYRRADA